MDFMKSHQIHIKKGVFMKYVPLNKTHEFHEAPIGPLFMGFKKS